MKIIEQEFVLNSDQQFKNKKEIFNLIAKTIQNKHKDLKIPDVVNALEKREQEGTTGVGDAMAIPHASIKIDSPKIIVIRLNKSLNWGSIDNKKVDLIISILVPDNEEGRKEHFKLLTDFSRKMVDEKFKEQLRMGESKEVEKLINSLGKEKEKEQTEVKEGVLSIVAITSCAVGIAHTYMAAEAIENGAKARGYNVKVEKRGGMGVEDKLSPEEIENADVCIIASEVNIDPSLFKGKRLFVTEASEAINLGDKYIDKAVKQAMIYKGDGGSSSAGSSSVSAIGENATAWKKVQKHLLYGVSWMLPFVVVSGIMLGVVNIITAMAYEPGADWALWNGNIFMDPMITFGKMGFACMFGVFSGATAYSIAGKPAVAPGVISGLMITNASLIFTGFNWTFLEPIADAGITGGFFGAVFTGLFVGWIVSKIAKVKVHKYAMPLMPVLIIPLFLSFFMFVLIKFVVGIPLALVMYGIYWILESIAAAGPAYMWLVGGLFGALAMVDLGGPINKTAFAVSMGLFFTADGFTEIWQPYAAFEVAIPVASIGALLATLISPKLFNERQKVEAQTAASMGCFGISEGAIPICISNPKVWMPANIIGGFVSGALVVLAGIIVYGGVAGPFLMVMGSVGNSYGPIWISLILWPIVTMAGAFATAFIAILLLKLEDRKEEKLALETNDKKEVKETSGKVAFSNEKILKVNLFTFSTKEVNKNIIYRN